MLEKILKIKDQKKMQKELDRWYKDRVESMQRLATHQDFNTLIEYWELEYKSIDNKLDSLKGRELEESVLERKIIKKHLNWINTIL